MSRMGIGAMLGHMSGNSETVNAVTGAVGKSITALAMKDDALCFGFGDGSTMRLFDDGQSCCEYRHMGTDDDLDYYVGSEFVGAEIKDGPEHEGEYGDINETQFLVIKTSKGEFTMVNHNEHNGYYGGFYVRATA